MSSITFKGEAWTIAKKPTHKAIGQKGRNFEVIGYFIAEESFEMTIAMECFDIEYGADYDRILAVEVIEEVVRHDPTGCDRISIEELLAKRKQA